MLAVGACITITLAYGFVLARYIPERLHLIANTLMSVLAILFGLWAGLDFEAMGLGVHLILKGVLVAIVCSLAIMLVVALVVLFVPAKRITTLPQIVRPGKIAYETAVRIPLSTALSEEILFRGVLLALLLQHSATLPGIIICSVVFGIWHVLPSVRDHAKTALLPIVIATAVAGIFFCWLRLLAGSIIAPWLVHWTINSSALLAVHFIRKKVHDIQ